MASDAAAGRYSLTLGLRALAIGVLGFVVCETVLMQRYASALVVAAVAGLIAFDLHRQVHQADRTLSRFVSAIAAGQPEAPAGGAFDRLDSALRALHGGLVSGRSTHQSETDYLRALVDTVAAALVVIEPDGRFIALNQSASKKLENSDFYGENADNLRSLLPGERLIIRLGPAQRSLALAAHFTAGGITRKLVSLQNIEGELDAVEIKAWQDLVRILSHEMMNSLTPIASLAQSLRPMVGDDRGDVLEAIDVIGQRSQGLMRFVERYREVSELPHPLKRSLVMGEVLAALERLLAPSVAERGIILAVVAEPGLIVAADPQLLEQALINLLSNAMEAVSNLPVPRIEVSAFSQDEHVVVRVADTGVGLPPELYERVFVPFFTTKAGGSGIGLSLTRQIVTAHGGQIDVRPNLPRGTDFRLYLPVQDPRPNL